MEIRELRAFLAVAEEGGLSAAARRLHVSQPALSQTIRSLERRLGVRLLVRDHTGARTTEAGNRLLRESRPFLAHYERVLAAMDGLSGGAAGQLRIGVPLEFPVDLLPAALVRLALEHPETRVELHHAASAAQLTALRRGELDLALVRHRPVDAELDAVLAVRESMGIILAESRATELTEPDGIQLHHLAGLEWIAFARSDSPAWHDLVAATLRAHGVAVDQRPEADGRPIIAEVKLAAVGTGRAFALAAPNWPRPLPDGIAWQPLIGDPIVRRTWAVWPASARARDLAVLVSLLDLADPVRDRDPRAGG